MPHYINKIRNYKERKSNRTTKSNDTTITTNMNYIQTFMSNFLKKFISKVKILSDKSETKQNILYFSRKDMGPLHNKAR